MKVAFFVGQPYFLVRKIISLGSHQKQFAEEKLAWLESGNFSYEASWTNFYYLSISVTVTT